MVRTQHFHCYGLGSIPGQGTASHLAWPKVKKKKILNKADRSNMNSLNNL